MYDHTQRGLLGYLGSLELAILEILWERGPLSAKDIRLELRLKRKLAPTTVLTVISRLRKKGFVHSERKRAVSIHRTAMSRNEFITARITETLHGLKENFSREFSQALKSIK